MRKLYIRARKGLAYLFRPTPSLFDFACAGLLCVNFIKGELERIIFFSFYIIFVLCISLFLEQKRQYKNLPLALFVAWSLIGVFVHSYKIPQQSIVLQYISLYLLSEGFIYILFGSLFLMTAIRYSRNIKFLYLLSPLLILPWIRDYAMGAPHKFTWGFAVVVSLLVYFLLKKRYILFSILSAFSLLFISINLKAVLIRFACRPGIFKMLVSQIILRPFVGSGFNKALSPDNMIVHPKWGWLYRHNDILSIGAYLGVPALIFIILFIAKLFKDTGINHRFIILLTLVLIASFQMTVFYPAKAISYLLILALIITENLKHREEICSGYL